MEGRGRRGREFAVDEEVLDLVLVERHVPEVVLGVGVVEGGFDLLLELARFDAPVEGLLEGFEGLLFDLFGYVGGGVGGGFFTGDGFRRGFWRRGLVNDLFLFFVVNLGDLLSIIVHIPSAVPCPSNLLPHPLHPLLLPLHLLLPPRQLRERRKMFYRLMERRPLVNPHFLRPLHPFLSLHRQRPQLALLQFLSLLLEELLLSEFLLVLFDVLVYLFGCFVDEFGRVVVGLLAGVVGAGGRGGGGREVDAVGGEGGF